jgi:hypothetical protein
MFHDDVAGHKVKVFLKKTKMFQIARDAPQARMSAK